MLDVHDRVNHKACCLHDALSTAHGHLAESIECNTTKADRLSKAVLKQCIAASEQCTCDAHLTSCVLVHHTGDTSKMLLYCHTISTADIVLAGKPGHGQTSMLQHIRNPDLFCGRLSQLKSGQSRGPDSISNEVLKHLPEGVHTHDVRPDVNDRLHPQQGGRHRAPLL